MKELGDGDVGGRPPIFEIPHEMREKIDEYFEYVKGEFHWECRTNDEGKEEDVKVWDRPPEAVTITGLCLHLGFESRQSFYDYEKRDGFSYIIKRARLMVENHYESTAQYARTPTFQIFALKNMGWSDKQEIDHSSSDGSMSTQPTKIVFTRGNRGDGNGGTESKDQ
ncbi:MULTISPECIES: DNA-packaging protein [unclassified Sphingobacterium]|uniref:DNA-packaging protein n=1 Tax=unclassified Sphingobacterium TaxID=2609468 RepID=UPI0020C3E08A|nr:MULTISPECIES: DNA-packaging protein [unclassified Sphingobacterium]